MTRWITEVSNTIFLIDKNGDGFPEIRHTTTPDTRRVETVTPVFTLEKENKPSIEQAPECDGATRAARGRSEE
jgi:hypothetical protein